MQINLKKITLAMALLISVDAFADAANYVGVDYNIRKMRGRDHSNYSMAAALPDIYHGYEVYAAHRFANDVGLSIGWEQTKNEAKKHVFSANENFVSEPQAAGNVSSVTARVEVIHLDLNGYYNFTENFEAIGQIGMGLIRVSMDASVLSGGVSRNLYPSNNFDNVIPRISFGLQYFTKLHIGIHSMISWQGTDLTHMSFTDADGLRNKIKPFSESWLFSIGIVGKF